MTEQGYAEFCNVAYRLRMAAEDFCAKLGDEEARQLDGLVRMEMRASPSAGKVEVSHDFLAAILAEDVANRSQRRALVGGQHGSV